MTKVKVKRTVKRQIPVQLRYQYLTIKLIIEIIMTNANDSNNN